PSQGADVGQVPPPIPEVLAEVAAQPGDVLFQAPADTRALIGADTNALIGITVLQGYDDLFLYAARLLDPQVLATLAATNNTVADYRAIEHTQVGIQLAFGILFVWV